jgi:hypothetical protein
MAMIVVGGSNRGVGKTALVCGLIAALSEYEWTAIKVTSHAHGFDQPIWEEPATPTNTSLAQEQGTDTSRYLAAGAHRALLCTSPPGSHDSQPSLPALLDQLWPLFGRGTNFIFESNSIVHHVNPNVCLLIHGGSHRELPLPPRKPSFTAAVRFADAMVNHSREDGITPEGLCLSGQPPKPIFHLAALERISPELLAWLRQKLPPAPHS